MKDTKLIQLDEILGKGRVDENRGLLPYLTLRMGTKAKYFFEAKSREDLINAKRASLVLKLPLYILGGGSNIFFTKPLIIGLVVKNIYQKKLIIQETDDTGEILVSSGYPTNLLVNQLIETGYQGLEYHLGLPGTVGGAIFMNSKWTNPLTYFGEKLIKADLIDTQGKIKSVDHDYFQFAYDSSVLQKTKEILLEVTFRFKKEDKQVLKQRAQLALQYRLRTQPKGVATCGCFFRNIALEEKDRLGLPTTSVGYLIDHAGLKGLRQGNFIVSDKHANFIVNMGRDKAKPEDLLILISLIKEKIKKKFKIDLKEEVISI
jgi:UDP-N-acetylenolpyruvoylglucosamine reductase